MRVFAFLPVVFWKSVLVFWKSVFVVFYEIVYFTIFIPKSLFNTNIMTHRINTNFEKIRNTPLYLYLRIRLNTLMYFIIVFMWKYVHTCQIVFLFCPSYIVGHSKCVSCGAIGQKKRKPPPEDWRFSNLVRVPTKQTFWNPLGCYGTQLSRWTT